jgi:hypothetical protein
MEAKVGFLREFDGNRFCFRQNIFLLHWYIMEAKEGFGKLVGHMSRSRGGGSGGIIPRGCPTLSIG